MVIYNVTVGVDQHVEQEWLSWMIDQHIPNVMKTGMFESYEIFKVLSHEDEGSSYAIQYRANAMSEIERYINEFAPALIQEHMERFKDRHVAFRSLLEKVG